MVAVELMILFVAPDVYHAFANPLKVTSQPGKIKPWWLIMESPVSKSPSSGMWSRIPHSVWRPINTTSVESKSIKMQWLIFRNKLRFFWHSSTTRRHWKMMQMNMRRWSNFLSGSANVQITHSCALTMMMELIQTLLSVQHYVMMKMQMYQVLQSARPNYRLSLEIAPTESTQRRKY